MRFGYTFELRWTVQRLIIVYAMTGIGATMWSCVLSPESVSVGASGALFGLLGADISYLVYIITISSAYDIDDMQ
jgi:membrane associated rhomboid family serine protease